MYPCAGTGQRHNLFRFQSFQRHYSCFELQLRVSHITHIHPITRHNMKRRHLVSVFSSCRLILHLYCLGGWDGIMWVPNSANKGSGIQIYVSVYTNLVFGIQIYACVCVNIYWECVHAVELSLPAVSASSPSRGWPWRPPAHPPSLPRHGQSHQSIQSRQHNESPSFLETATDLQPIISLMGIMLWSEFDEKFSFIFISASRVINGAVLEKILLTFRGLTYEEPDKQE